MSTDTNIQKNETLEEYIKRQPIKLSKPTGKKVGRKNNTGRLSEENQNMIFELLKEKPIRYNIKEQPMWSTKSIQLLISLKLNIELPLSTIRDYLNKWFNIKQNQKGNQIKSLSINECILKDLKKDKAILLFIKSIDKGFIHIVTRANENKFIFNGNENQKNLTNSFQYLINYYKDIYLFFDYTTSNKFFSIETLFNKLLNKNKHLRIFFIENPMLSFIFKNTDEKFHVKEYKKITSKSSQIKKELNLQQEQNIKDKDIIDIDDFLEI